MNLHSFTNLQFISFLFFVVLISFSGVLSPGPLTATAIAKGYKNKNAGVFISLGHAAVEIPLIFLLYFGLSRLFSSNSFKIIISFIGGVALLWLGFNMIKEKNYNLETKDIPYDSFFAGIIATSSNPYFFLWWATIGVGLIFTASQFGFFGVVIFSFVHWLCDFVWYRVLSLAVFKIKKLTNKLNLILKICGVTLAIYGVWFLTMGVKLIHKS